MTKLTTASFALMAALTVQSTPATAQNEQAICSYYGNVGAAAIDFLMPLRFSQVVEMISGKDKALMDQMSKAVESKGTPQVRKAIENMGQGSLALMGEAAGMHGFQLVMTGQATSGQEVFGILTSQCMDIGPGRLIDAQRRARAVEDPDAQ